MPAETPAEMSDGNDPKLRYRDRIAKIAEKHDGHIDAFYRRGLVVLRDAGGLTVEEAAQIEREVLEPYRIRRENLQKYGELVQAAIAHHGGIDESNRWFLQQTQAELGLTAEEVAEMRMRGWWSGNRMRRNISSRAGRKRRSC